MTNFSQDAKAAESWLVKVATLKWPRWVFVVVIAAANAAGVIFHI